MTAHAPPGLGIYDIRRYGAKGDGANDDALAIQGALNAIPPAGGLIIVPPGTWTWKSVPALPKDVTGRLRIIGDAGAAIKLTSTGSRAFDFNKTADHDTFQNIEITDLLIDCNNIGGQHHVVLGTYAAGVTTSRINIAHLAIRRVRTINVPVDSTLTNHRLNVYLVVQQPLASEGTQDSIQNILVEDCRFEGGNMGAVVGAVVGSGTSVGLNVFIDNIHFNRLWHSLLAAQSSSFSSANFFIGARGKGGRCTIDKCYGQFSGDIGVEIDAMSDGIANDTVIEDAFGASFYHTNYNNPIDATAQTIKFSRCQSRRINVAGTAAYSATTNLGLNLGVIEYSSCTALNKTGLSSSAAEGINFAAAAKRVSIREFRCFSDFNYTGSGNVFPPGININPSALTLIEIRDAYIRTTGSRGGTGTLNFRALNVRGNTVLDADNIVVDVQTTGLSSGSTNAYLSSNSSTTLRGVLRRLKVMGMGDDANPIAINIAGSGTVAITSRFDISDADFTGMTAGTEISIGDNTNKAKVFFRNILWRTFPKASAAMGTSNFVAGTFTSATGNQYIGGAPALIQFANGSGAAITAIDISKDGTTYENVWTQASGAMAQSVEAFIDNGDYVKVTFATTQPTTRVVFLK